MDSEKKKDDVVVAGAEASVAVDMDPSSQLATNDEEIATTPRKKEPEKETSKQNQDNLTDLVKKYPLLNIKAEEDDLTKTRKQKWNRCLTKAVEILESPCGTDPPPAGPSTRESEKSSYERALDAYNEVKELLIKNEESTEDLDLGMKNLEELSQDTIKRLREADEKLRKELDMTKNRNSRAGSKHRHTSRRSKKSDRSHHSSISTYTYNSQGERISEALKSHLQVLKSHEEAKESEELERLQQEQRLPYQL